MLSSIRVLDLTNERGLMAGSILGDLGADVIQVEPPGGSAARRLAPFARGYSAPENSLFWWGYARNKRGIALDLESDEGKAGFKRLARTADCVIESFEPGRLANLGLDYDELAKVNPGLILSSITPFGQTGPKASWPASDLTILAASGYQELSGDSDRAPLRIAVAQSYAHASMDAVVGTLVALQERKLSGLGQHVDVSAQISASISCIPSMLRKAWKDPSGAFKRASGGMNRDGLFYRGTFPAKDGWVCMTFSFGKAIGPATRRVVEWMYDEGASDDSLLEKDFINYPELIAAGKEPASDFERMQDEIAAFLATKTKAEIAVAATERNLLIVPVSTIHDVRHDEHLGVRQFFVPADPAQPEIKFPGPFAKIPASPLSLRRRAPRLGEHNQEVFSELARLPASASRPPLRRATSPFSGLKIVDIGWVMVGPSAIRVFADFGATVIKVESTRRIDTVRTLGPMKDGIIDPERSAPFHDFNCGKLGLALNLNTPEARDVVRRLARWADILSESFTPRAMRGWGLDYESLRELNPSLIYVSTCLGGQFGPMSKKAGYGTHGAALAGFYGLCGWKDRPPAGPMGPYTDYVAPKFITTAVLAALEHRERTGVGQHVDVAQMEAPIHFLTPALLDYEVNGHVMEADGNRSPDMAPHGVYRTLGADRWIAIAVTGDLEWQALCALIGRPALANDSRLEGVDGRKRCEDEIDAIIADWAAEQTAENAQATLIAGGVAAHIVAGSEDLARDEQIAHRGHLVTLTHATIGDVTVENTRFQLSHTPSVITRPGPTYGQDRDAILSGLLGYSVSEIAALEAAGALE